MCADFICSSILMGMIRPTKPAFFSPSVHILESEITRLLTNKNTIYFRSWQLWAMKSTRRIQDLPTDRPFLPLFGRSDGKKIFPRQRGGRKAGERRKVKSKKSGASGKRPTGRGQKSEPGRDSPDIGAGVCAGNYNRVLQPKVAAGSCGRGLRPGIAAGGCGRELQPGVAADDQGRVTETSSDHPSVLPLRVCSSSRTTPSPGTYHVC